MTIFESANIACSATLEYYIDSYYTIGVVTSVDDFKGRRDFCLSYDNLMSFIYKSKEMLKTLKGTVTLEDYDSESFILFELTTFQLNVSGTFTDASGGLRFDFSFVTDQTFLGNLVFFMNSISHD